MQSASDCLGSLAEIRKALRLSPLTTTCDPACQIKSAAIHLSTPKADRHL
jgi:hypothetical protein